MRYKSRSGETLKQFLLRRKDEAWTVDELWCEVQRAGFPFADKRTFQQNCINMEKNGFLKRLPDLYRLPGKLGYDRIVYIVAGSEDINYF